MDDSFLSLAQRLQQDFKKKLEDCSNSCVNSRGSLDELRLLQGRYQGVLSCLEELNDILSEVRKKGFVDD